MLSQPPLRLLSGPSQLTLATSVAAFKDVLKELRGDDWDDPWASSASGHFSPHSAVT